MMGGPLIPIVDSLGDTLGVPFGFGGGGPCGSWVPCNLDNTVRSAFYNLGDDLLRILRQAGARFLLFQVATHGRPVTSRNMSEYVHYEEPATEIVISKF